MAGTGFPCRLWCVSDSRRRVSVQILAAAQCRPISQGGRHVVAEQTVRRAGAHRRPGAVLGQNPDTDRPGVLGSGNWRDSALVESPVAIRRPLLVPAGQTRRLSLQR